MILLRYSGEKTSYAVSFTRISKHIMQVKGDFPAKGKGFILYRMENPDDPWDYLAYKTVYQEIDGGVQFSDDGSVYVAPPEPEPPVEPEPYEPTEEELAAMLEQNKKAKIALSKNLLEVYLEEHPLTSTAHGGVEGIYSVTNEKQSLMTSQYMTYQIEKAVNPEAELTWNETGKSCKPWTEDEFMQLILEIKKYVYPLVSHQQTLEEQIVECSTQEQLDEIVIDYSAVVVQGD